MSEQNTTPEIPQLLMLRKSLKDLPALSLPYPYRARSAEASDGSAWEEIIQEAFGVFVPYASLTESPAFRPERVWFIVDEADRPVATAACWVTDDYPKSCSVLHMVATKPGHTGLHLGAAATLAAMQEAAREGFARMCLRTDLFRVPAIKTYLRLGFVPQILHEAHIDQWKTLLPQVGRGDLAAQRPASYDGRGTIEICG